MTRITVWSISVWGDGRALWKAIKKWFCCSSLSWSHLSPSHPLPKWNLSFLNIPFILPSFTPSLEPLLWTRHYSRNWECNISSTLIGAMNTYLTPTLSWALRPSSTTTEHFLSSRSKWRETGHRLSRLLPSLHLWFQKRRKVPTMCRCAFNPLQPSSHNWKAAGVEFKPQVCLIPTPLPWSPRSQVSLALSPSICGWQLLRWHHGLLLPGIYVLI